MKKIIAKSYARLIVAGRKTMDEVPEDMKSYVEEALKEMGYVEPKPSTDKKQEETTNSSVTESKDEASTDSDNKEQSSDSSTTTEQEN